MKTKVCAKCLIEKPLDEFCRDRSLRSGRRSRCSVCTTQAKKDYYRKHPEKQKEESRYRRGKNPERERKAVTKSRYGLTQEEIQRFSLAQRGVCDICGNPETMKYQGIVKLLSIDHNHITNKVRGILCQSCNSMLGYAKVDTTETNILLKAISYLERTKNGQRGRK